MISGKNLKHPKNRQDENSEGISISMEGLTLTNGWVDDVPGGIVVRTANCTFQKLKFLRIGKDALSTSGEAATGIRITGCEFWNDHEGDKSIQLNQAAGAILTDVLVVGGETGIRLQKTSYHTENAVCRLQHCTFQGCATGFNASGGVTVKTNLLTFRDTGKKWVTSNGAKVQS